MSELVSREPRRNLRRAELRAYLLNVGPQDVDHLLAFARSIDPSTEREWLEEQLETRTALFERLPDGRYRGCPEEPTVVVKRRAATRPRPRPRRQTPTAHWEPPPQPEPSGRSVDLDADNRLRRVEVSDPVVWREEGRRLVVPLPPDGAASPVVLESIAAAAQGATQVEVFAAAADGTVVFRGTRPVVTTTVDAAAGRTFVTFGPAANDTGLAYTRARRRLAAGEEGSAALVPFDPVTDPVELSPETRRIAALPVPSKRATGAYASELTPRLAQLAADRSGWPRFVEWLVPMTRQLGRQDVENLVRRLCSEPAVPTGGLLALLVDDLHLDDVTDPQCARALLIAAADHPHQEARFAAWALDNHAELALTEPTAALQLFVARVAHHAARHEEATRLYASCADELGDRLEADDLTDWIDSAIQASLRDDLGNAFELARTRAMIDPSGDGQLRDVLWHAVDTVSDTGLSPHAFLRDAIHAFLAVPDAEEEATELALAYMDPGDDAALLELLSLFETAARRDTVDWLLQQHLQRLGRLWHDLTPHGQRDERQRLELVERILGRPELVEHFPVDDEQDSNLDTDEASPLTWISGRRVVIVGGYRTTYQRIREQLEPFEPDNVAHIEPSWDRNRSARDLKPALTTADVVVEVTSQMKHQDSEVLTSALASGNGPARVRAAGGPSQVVLHLERWLETVQN